MKQTISIWARARILLFVAAVLFSGDWNGASGDSLESKAGVSQGNRLTYLDDFSNPYYPNLHFPKLVTPQWIGEEGVDAVVTLGIDDMREVERYEAYLRPILDRLQEIYGYAPVSIVTNSIDPSHPHLQKWLAEGVTIEAHTVDHPCPCLRDGDFEKAKSTYDRCVDQIYKIPGNHPVAFRFPCCDSLNTPSPRAFAEIINALTPEGNFLQASSSICAPMTADDPDLPRKLVQNTNGTPRFSRYVPFELFVNKVENYPYPFPVGKVCWEFPLSVPSDWQAQKLQKPNNPKTVEDLKAAVDATVIKQGMANIVFHPHGWIRSDQMVEVIDHAIDRWGERVRFLNFPECIERLNKHLLSGQSLRAEDGGDNGVRLLDLNDDGYLDVVIGNGKLQQTRLWKPNQMRWDEKSFPIPIVDSSIRENIDQKVRSAPRDAGVRFGVLSPNGVASFLVRNEKQSGVWHFHEGDWKYDPGMLAGLMLDGKPVMTSLHGVDQGVRFRDVDADGICEVIVSNPNQNAVFKWNAKAKQWVRQSFSLPEDAVLVDANGRDAGLRFIDVNEDGRADVLFSDDYGFGLHLFGSMQSGWSNKVLSGDRTAAKTIPQITRAGRNNGAWFAERHLWVQNEDTTRLPGGVDRRSFKELLGDRPAAPKSPDASLQTIEVPEGFAVELVASEPLVRDPVAFDWGADGALYVIEMIDYPEGIDGKGQAGGRLSVLRDLDKDGIYEQSTVMIDGLNFPTGVMVWRDGVLITAAPDIFFVRDTDGDDVADSQETLFTGFGVGNQQHRVNGLVYGLDHWLYLANGSSGGKVSSGGQPVDVRGRDIRIAPDQSLVEAVTGQTQYGRDRDDWGNWFGCNNPNPIFHFVLSDRYLKRNPAAGATHAMRDIYEGSRRVFPLARIISHCNRNIRPLGAPAIFTSAGSTIVYRDTLFGPRYVDETFTSEPAYNLIHRRHLIPEGVTFRSERFTEDKQAEFIRSSDPWFRPTRLRVGPDGALYFADMYRRVIEHPQWLDPEVIKTTNVRDGHDRGRIYRILPVGSQREESLAFDQLDATQLVKELESSNGFRRDLAQRMLVWQADPRMTPLLEDMVTRGTTPQARLHALYTLNALETLKEEVLIQSLGDAHPGVRRHAIQVSESFLKAPSLDLRKRILALGADSDPQIQLQLLYTLGEWDDAAAAKLLGQLLLRYRSDSYLRAAAISSLNQSNLATVFEVVRPQLAEEATENILRPLIGSFFRMADAKQQDVVLREILGEGRAQPVKAWQLDALAEWLDTICRPDGTASAMLAQLPSGTSIEGILRKARDWLSDPTATEQQKRYALRLLMTSDLGTQDDLVLVAQLLSPEQTPLIQSYAVSALERRGDSAAIEQLLAELNTRAPERRALLLESIFRLPRGPAMLLEKIEQGALNASLLDTKRKQRLRNASDSTIANRARKLFDTPPDLDRVRVLKDHQQVASLKGDPLLGKILFEKQCSACHQLEGIGHAIGPNLATLRDRTPESLLISILDPNRAVEPRYLEYQIENVDGRIFSGLIISESEANVVLATGDGKQHTMPRQHIVDLRTNGQSLMPEGLEKEISPQQLADVIAFVAISGNLVKDNPPDPG